MTAANPEDPIGTPKPDASPQPPQPPAPAPEPQRFAMPDFKEWRSSLDPELRDQPSLQDIESFEGLIREHANVQRFIGGDKIAKPSADASEEDWSRFYGAMGRPDRPDDYDLTGFQPPENVPWDNDFQQNMVNVLHKNGVTQQQLVGILNDYASDAGERYAAARTTLQSQHDEAARALQTEWGGAFDANTELAGRAFREVFGDELEEIANAVLPDGTPIGDHPVFMRAFFKLGRKMSEHGLVSDPSRRVAPVMTPAEAKARIAELEADPEFRSVMADASQAEHPKRREWNQLYEYLDG